MYDAEKSKYLDDDDDDDDDNDEEYKGIKDSEHLFWRN